jgi:hypothetical protein
MVNSLIRLALVILFPAIIVLGLCSLPIFVAYNWWLTRKYRKRGLVAP